ncbi:Beta-lactamase-related domain-containing protein [Pleurotus pulmonarius]
MRILTFKLFLVARLSQVFAQYTETNDPLVVTPAIDTFINSILTDWGVPGGLSIAVVKKTGESSWNVETKGYGNAKSDKSHVTSNTLFNIASNSKLFTALSTGILIADPVIQPPISWNTKVASIVPEWSLSDPVASKSTNLIDLISHRVGMPRHDYAYHATDKLSDHIKKYRHLKPSAELREAFQYNNNMYALLSYLPTVLLPSSPNLARYVKAKIFDPLDMSATTYSYQIALQSGNLAEGFARQGMKSALDPGTPRALPYWDSHSTEDGDLIAGAGGIISNAVDMAKWLQTLLLNGKNPKTGSVVIPADAIQTVSTGHIVDTTVPYGQVPLLTPAVYGGGQTIRNYKGHVIMEHGGSVSGFNSMVARLPFDGLGIAVLTNDDAIGGYMSFAIVSRLVDEALGIQPEEWKTSFESFISAGHSAAPQPLPRPSNATDPKDGFKDLAGVYEDKGYGRLELCLLPPPPVVSSACRDVVANVTLVLPGSVDPNVPTFIARWNKQYSTYLRFTHVDGNTFNVASLNPFPTGNASEPWWFMTNNVGTTAEFGRDEDRRGFGLFGGFWGAGAGVPSPSTGNLVQRSEVWFNKA